MNPKIEKLKAERSRNIEKISDLQNRNRKLSEQITKLENKIGRASCRERV